MPSWRLSVPHREPPYFTDTRTPRTAEDVVVRSIGDDNPKDAAGPHRLWPHGTGGDKPAHEPTGRNTWTLTGQDGGIEPHNRRHRGLRLWVIPIPFPGLRQRLPSDLPHEGKDESREDQESHSAQCERETTHVNVHSANSR
jgi:hypothetical protein